MPASDAVDGSTQELNCLFRQMVNYIFEEMPVFGVHRAQPAVIFRCIDIVIIRLLSLRLCIVALGVRSL